MNKLISIILTFVSLTLSFSLATAQKKVQYLQYEDLKPYHFGFLIGLHSQDLILDHSGAIDTNGDKWYGNVNKYTPGFSVGVIADLRLADFLSLRTTPTIHFGSKDVTLVSDAAGSTPVTANVRSNYILIPMNLRYRGSRTDNYRPYVMSGFSAGLDMGRDKLQPLLLQPINLYWEIGAGCDIYMPYFRLVPELKVCLGMGDILVHNRTDQSSDAFLKYSNAFDAITSRLIVFSLQFE
ncbi:MAG TPA: porin family protein [Bacteroidales bacterium]|nr:porin family protein [Bacteroidales bacterium]